MNINIHPLVVHFPIALLCLYALIEVVRFPIVKRQPYWFHLKATLVILGTLSSYVAIWSGQIAEHSYGRTPLVRLHGQMASATVTLFTIVAVAYLISWIYSYYPRAFDSFAIGRILIKLTNIVLWQPVAISLAIVGLGMVIVTAGLGGALVYGTDFDPFMRPIFHYLNIQ